MRLATMALLLMLLVGFGCLEQKIYPGSMSERVVSSQPVDLDDDSITDYAVYVFAPLPAAERGMTIQRTVTMATETVATYTNLTPELSDVDVLMADQDLEEFAKSRGQAESGCSGELGMGTVMCSDAPTCTRLCSSASVKCKKIASVYDEVLAGSIVTYVQDMADMRSLLTDARRMVVKLSTAPREDKDTYLGKTREIVARIAEENANPLYTHPDVAMCQHADYGMPELLTAAKRIGTYTTEPLRYRYVVLISAKPLQAKTGTATEVSGISITDRLPRAVVENSERISSAQEITAAENGSDVYIAWNSPRASREGYLFSYSFTTTAPPESVLQAFRTPTFMVKKINLSALTPTEWLFEILNGRIRNYYVSLGLALGISLAVPLLIYNLAVFMITLILERGFAQAFRKAFGKTSVTWKTDAIMAIIALGAGAYVCFEVATQPATVPTLMEALDFLARNGTGMVGLAFILTGTLLAYFTVENLVKIMMLETAYGMTIRREKDALLTEAARLKDMLRELEALVEKARGENFDTGPEYDVLIATPPEKIDALAKVMTPQNKTLIDDYTARVASAIKNLNSKRKLAEENWPAWSDSIAKLIAEQEEVYVSSLAAIPVSMRPWALGRYIKEKGTEGIVYEHDAIRKKKMTMVKVVGEMLGQQLITGAIVLNHEKLEHAEFADGSGATVKSVLALKLRAYMNSLARNMGQKEPVSLLVVGAAIALVYTKDRSREFFLFVGKDKFGQAMEQWKAKTKTLE